jgi:aspartyl-tRNA(Asn)/glutamyl-tRNA(Gln) amidotransferase subunit B
MKNFQMDIGLEVHIRLNTKSKIFSPAPNKFGCPPNSIAHYIDLGLPGTLPLLNREVVYAALKLGLVLNANINQKSVMCRKHYFYPDLSKGYQITQGKQPIATGGYLRIQGVGFDKNVGIADIHLEEDAGKLVHTDEDTNIDYNRAGSPLIELVTLPELKSAEEVASFLIKLRALVQRLNISGANMEEGAFKADINISLREEHATTLGTRREIKNLNSLRFITQVIKYEYEHQSQLLLQQLPVMQETCTYVENVGITVAMRAKENPADYRYMPDPDILPLYISDQDMAYIQQDIPLLEDDRTNQLFDAMNESEFQYLTRHPHVADYYKEVCKHLPQKEAYNWVCIELIGVFQKMGISFSAQIMPVRVLIEVVNHVKEENISLKSARVILKTYPTLTQSVDELIQQLQLKQDNDYKFIKSICYKILKDHPKSITDYHAGKTKVITFLIGTVMKQASDKKRVINPHMVSKIMQELLENDQDQDQDEY